VLFAGTKDKAFGFRFARQRFVAGLWIEHFETHRTGAARSIFLKPVAPQELNVKRSALVPAQGGTRRLSVKKKGGSPSGADKAMQKRPSEEKKNRKQRASDIGRALRTIYDDTLRETVPDDFSDLLGKLS
jgi:hypothetical protein